MLPVGAEGRSGLAWALSAVAALVGGICLWGSVNLISELDVAADFACLLSVAAVGGGAVRLVRCVRDGDLRERRLGGGL